MNQNLTSTFDPESFLDQLIEEMRFDKEAPEKVEMLKEGLAITLHNKMFDAASQAIEPEVVEAAVEKYADEKDLWQFMLKLLQMSPAAQAAMTEAIEEFKDETLAAYEILSNGE